MTAPTGARVGDLAPARERPRATVERLFHEHGKYVWRVLRQLGVAEPEIDDVCQEVFVVALRRIESLHDETGARAWLYAIAIRAAAGHRRVAYRRYESTTHPPPDRAEGPASSDLVEQTDARRKLARIDALLARLDERHRAAFVLIELEGLSFTEVAEILECALPTAYAWHQKARARLLAMLAEESER